LPVLKGEDIVMLLRLAANREKWTVRSLQDDTGIPRSVIHRSVERLVDAGLLDTTNRSVNISQAEEFLVHGAKYVFPPAFEGEVRGIPTAWAAPPLKNELAPAAGLSPVWPDPMGRARGIALQPLHPAAVEISRRDPALAELLALVDALRIGDARTRELAAKMLGQRFNDKVTER
jgi:hypothetical protein